MRIIAPEESPSSPSFAVKNIKAKQDKHEDLVGFHTQNIMGQLSKLRKINMGVYDKVSFLDYYLERKSGVYSKKIR